VSLSDVETAILATWRAYHRPKLVFDPYQAAQLSERLQTAMVRTEEFTFSTAGVNRLARSLYGALRDRAIVLPDDDGLLTELASVRLVETGPGLVRLDHRAGGHDDQAVAVALVLVELTDLAQGGGRPFLWPDEEVRYEAALRASGQPHRQVLPSWHHAGIVGDFALHPEDLDGDNVPGQTKRSPF